MSKSRAEKVIIYGGWLEEECNQNALRLPEHPRRGEDGLEERCPGSFTIIYETQTEFNDVVGNVAGGRCVDCQQIFVGEAL